ncbi:iron ABC transporter permease [uncultured Secundilactobacillus sp.]|uniref:FecCD family ABC transporter permease n=1 Tax=uncultured Secundilactobacillus sp. TaxID=2813935 RepID=UPI002583E1CC|nr:iron ABC transporter permease [uncultured Secundilactobacillus sp.]
MKRERLAYAVVVIGLLMTIFVALMSGVDFYSLAEVGGAVTGQNNTAFNTVMMFRLPRILAALICGGMLSVAGAFSQSVFRNQLADPSILGMTSAGDFFILIGGLLLPNFPFQKAILAVLGGVIVLHILARPASIRQPLRLIIVGVALNLTFVGFQQVLTSGTVGLGGQSFNGITWQSTLTLLGVGTLGLIAALVVAPWANYLKLGDQQLAGVGVPVTAMRWWLLALVIYLTCGVTAVIGTIPFMGIVIPNIGRRVVGHDYQTLIPFSMLSGAWLLLIADTVGRLVVLPSELAAASIMTVIGGPFLVIMLQKGGHSWN